MITKDTAKTMQDYLDSVKSTVAEITDPATGQPVQIPDFDSLHQAAGKLDSTKHPQSFVHMIQVFDPDDSRYTVYGTAGTATTMSMNQKSNYFTFAAYRKSALEEGEGYLFHWWRQLG